MERSQNRNSYFEKVLEKTLKIGSSKKEDSRMKRHTLMKIIHKKYEESMDKLSS